MKKIRLSKGLWATVSPEDYDFLSRWKWSASHESRGTKWYAVRFEMQLGRRVKIRMHRVVMERITGFILPEALVVDHENHDGLDNRRGNLSLVTQEENMRRSPGWKRKGVPCKTNC